MKQKNFVFISVDALRRDYLNIYNKEISQVTFIDKMAKEGITFSNAIANGNWTIPAHGSMFYGITPDKHQILNWGNTLPSFKNIFDFFKESGYSLGYFSSEGVRNLVGEISKKFDEIGHTNDKNIFNFCNRKKPFFIFWHFLDTHAPYGIKADKQISKDEIDYFVEKNDYNYIRYLLCNGKLDDIQTAYKNQIRKVARSIHDFVERLSETGQLENTVIVITADHGEVWKPYTAFHCNYSEEVLQIPLIFWNTGMKSRIVTQLVSQIDILPTLLDISNIQFHSELFDGKSLMPLFKGLKMSAPPVTILGPDGFVNDDIFAAIRDEKWMYIFNIETGEDELYDIVNDPEHTQNLVLNKMKMDVLDEFKKKANAIRSKYLPNDIEHQETSQDVLERLKSLGYI